MTAEESYNQLVQDTHVAITDMADMLVKQGHRNIVCAGRQSANFDVAMEYFKAKNIKCTLVEEVSNLDDFPDYHAIGRQLVKKILALPKKPTAIIFSNDARALGGMRALMEAGYSIPGDFSIVGCDNIPGSELFHPALTTIELAYTAGVDAAVEMILQQKMNEHYILPGKLIERESTS